MSGYRYVTQPITLLDDAGEPIANGEEEQSVDFIADFLRNRIRDPQHFGGDIDGIVAAITIEQEFKGKKPGEVVKLPKAEWDRLVGSVSKPTGGYNVAIMMQTLSFGHAVTKAPEKPPTKNAATK
jgi:hypothetical protein